MGGATVGDQGLHIRLSVFDRRHTFTVRFGVDRETRLVSVLQCCAVYVHNAANAPRPNLHVRATSEYCSPENCNLRLTLAMVSCAVVKIEAEPYLRTHCTLHLHSQFPVAERMQYVTSVRGSGHLIH